MKTIKKINFILALLFIGSISINAQTDYDLDPFDEIQATGMVHVTLKKGTSLKAIVNAKGIDYDDIKVSVSEGTLKILVLKSLIKHDAKIDIEVTYDQIRKIKAQAGAHFTGTEILTGDLLSLRANHASEIQIDVAVNKLEAITAEGGAIKVKGTSEIVDVRASSGAKFNGLELISNYTYANANTGGSAKVVAKESLEASANTGGMIEYKGKPTKTKTKKSFKGKVKEI